MYTRNLCDVDKDDINYVGGKACSLGEMINNLDNLGIDVPKGFVLTTESFDRYMEYNNIIIDEHVKTNILNGTLPEEIIEEVTRRYTFKKVAIRSSATAEDLPGASFAGQQDTYLNVIGIENVLENIIKCYASLFNERAVSYRQSRGYLEDIKLAVVVQEMVSSKCSGVAFSVDTETGFDGIVLINASYGLGEMVVSGNVIPDEYIVFKQTGKMISKTLGNKDKMMNSEGITNVPIIDQTKFCMTETQVEELASAVIRIEKHYNCNIDVEWAYDDKLYILQARPETVHNHILTSVEKYSINSKEKPVAKGIAVGDKIASGKQCYIDSIYNSHLFVDGNILVTDITNPDWEPLMKRSNGIITRNGGRTCHAAIVAREMGLPCIVGVNNDMDIIQELDVITISCAEGQVGYIYEGKIEYTTEQVDIDSLRNKLENLSTSIMLNVGSPDSAFKYACLPNCGVGLAREEFIINNYIGIHPLALLNNIESDIIKSMIAGYSSGRDYFISKLSHGMAKIAASFYPKDVIIRFSDFKTNEYMNLIEGDKYEPIEENPMIGWRGASRYYSKQYREAFGMECLAVRRVREEMGLTNLIVMVPFVRSTKELELVYEVMSEYGLERGKEGLQVYMMAEIPANVILADVFCKYVDGFSIGSNDLTQTILATDRDNSMLNDVFDEMNPAVIKSIEHLIKTCKEHSVKIGICGQGPSDNVEFAKLLVEYGIDSISVTPDALGKTINNLWSNEKL